ncbi:MAG: CDP-alcohol phosphatidyltransferase family protein [Bacilli bacterium]
MQENTIMKIVVNSITSLRLLGTFLMIPIYLCFGWLVTAVVAGILFATDFIDGTMARHFHVETFFGSVLDTVADKSFAIIILAILAFINPLFLICIFLEICISIVNYKSIQKGNNVQSSKIGKIKTFILDLTVVITLIIMALDNLETFDFNIPFEIISFIIVMSTSLAQVITLRDYIIKSIKGDITNKKCKEKRGTVLKTYNEILYILFNTEFYHKHRADKLLNLLYK